METLWDNYQMKAKLQFHIRAYPSKPSILQTTCASLMSQLSSQITPHSPLYWSSTLPEFSLSPSIRRIPKGGMVLPAKITDINRTRWKNYSSYFFITSFVWYLLQIKYCLKDIGTEKTAVWWHYHIPPRPKDLRNHHGNYNVDSGQCSGHFYTWIFQHTHL